MRLRDPPAVSRVPGLAHSLGEPPQPLPPWWDRTSCAVLHCTPSPLPLCFSSADCDSYCKPAKGNYKINMKKYCKKDYGKGPLLLPSSIRGLQPPPRPRWLILVTLPLPLSPQWSK